MSETLIKPSMYLLKCSGSWVGGYNGKNSFPEVFRKKGVLKNLAKFTVKHLLQSLLFNEVADLRPILRTSVLENSFRRLLLYF